MNSEARYFRSLTYEGDTLPFFESFNDWEHNLFHPAYLLECHNLNRRVPGPTSSERTRRAYMREPTELRNKPRHQFSQVQLHSAWTKYVSYLKEQDIMREDDYSAGKIADALARLPNLESIVFSLEGWAGEKQKTCSCLH